MNHRRKSWDGSIPAEVRDFVHKVAETFHPEKILLFGSRCRGLAQPDSDYDLLVVMHHDGHPCTAALEILRKVPKSFPLDLIVRSPETVRQRLAWGDPFLTEIFEEGLILHESACP